MTKIIMIEKHGGPEVLQLKNIEIGKNLSLKKICSDLFPLRSTLTTSVGFVHLIK